MNLFDFFKNSDEKFVGQSQLFAPPDLFSVNKDISEKDILLIPTAKACIDKIADQVAALPIKLYKENADGSVESVPDYRYKLLNEEPNETTKGHNLKKQFAQDYLIHGGGYIATVQAGNTILELHPLKAERVSVVRKFKNGYVSGANIFVEPDPNSSRVSKIKIPHYEVIIATNDPEGLLGIGAKDTGKLIFRQALLEMARTSNYYERAGIPVGILKYKGRLATDKADTLVAKWKQKFMSAINSGETMFLNEDLDYEPLSPQTIDTANDKAAINKEICKVFNIPYGMIEGGTKNDYQSIEQNNRAFLNGCLNPILEKMIAGINATMLLESEKENGFFFAFDVSELEKATHKENVETVVAGVQGGLFKLNEGRAMLNLPKLPKDYSVFAPGTTLLDENGKVVVSSQDQQSNEIQEGEADE